MIDRYYNMEIKKINWEGEEVGVIILTEITSKLFLDKAIKLNKYKDDILANVSHDLRTPLNASLSYLTRALEISNHPDKENNQEIPDLIKKSIKNEKILLSLISDILDYSQAKA